MTDTSSVHLGPNQYGKAEVRLVRVTRDTDRHEIEDLTITTQLRGAALADSYTSGDNAKVLATDTQKNTVYAFAREHGVHSPEEFLLRLGRHFTTAFDWYEGATLTADQHGWARIPVDGRDHDHAFVRAGSGTRTAVVQVDGDDVHVLAGVTDLTVLKSTGSEFHGFPRDRYTTLAETDDRILATSVTARWRYLPEAVEAGIDWNATHAGVLERMLATFADLHSYALQQTLFAMGRAAIEAFPEIAEVRFSMPNKHHFLVDLAPFGLDNPNEVFYAADRPYGLISGSVVRDGVAEAPAAWTSVPGFV
ncbi:MULTISPECIES: factor-independent urate hydroxylase [unclassified Curtobacterium]|uniref:factor-independent urate hydroxylase n=1 Tax=unclassified Curtobacterium TaxID=257496 RepID=UPI000DA9612E|nr:MULTISPECIES: urate oxidase [unclassified Curtobacterium]PZE28668.1 urate oxidase [Curtobacterium sp. MCBD17_028]PZF59307.1 urate oxidase [Curtobacterium sp. MCBD17_034]PZM32854.1 urate oxidase [Curtobacterium sp. MCBD17_031]WIE56120.1 urate oxidase [Curtobacterium sp. MCBD17_003]